MIQNLAKGLDETTNTRNNQATQAENDIRLASVERPGTATGRFLKPWQRGNKDVLAAANAVVEALFDRTRLPGFLNQLQQARSHANSMIQSGGWRERRLGQAYLRDIAASEAEVRYAQAHWNDPALKQTATRIKMAEQAGFITYNDGWYVS